MWKLLVAIDGSERALAALEHAVALAHQGLPVALVLAHVQEPASLYELVTSRDPDRIAAASQEAGAHLLQAAVQRAEESGLPFEVAVEVGDPARSLMELAQVQQCDGIVVTARGQGALRSALLGSVSQELARMSAVPVTIVRGLDAIEAETEGDDE